MTALTIAGAAMLAVATGVAVAGGRQILRAWQSGETLSPDRGREIRRVLEEERRVRHASEARLERTGPTEERLPERWRPTDDPDRLREAGAI